MFSTAAAARGAGASRAALALTLLLGGCAAHLVPAGRPIAPARETARVFVMPDGMRLPYRVWRPTGHPCGRPSALVLALHGMDDSRDAFAIPAPAFTAAGVELIAPDQRGFGATAVRGYWPGRRTLVADARTMVGLLAARHPGVPIYVMGESMGAAVAMLLAAGRHPPPVAGWILVSPAVWGWQELNPFERAGLWLMIHVAPDVSVGGGGLHIVASDNRAALRALGRDPLTLLATRWDAIGGLVRLMGAAAAAAPRLPGDALVLYGGKDQLVPARAMRAMWHALRPSPAGPRIAYYPDGYHLMLRDLGRAEPLGDILGWMRAPRARLASGAGGAARRWMGGRRMLAAALPRHAARADP